LSQDEYTRIQVAEELSKVVKDFPAHRVQMYTDRGIITPHICDAKGRGTIRKYDKVNILEIAIITELREIALTLKDIKKIFEMVDKTGQKDDIWFKPDSDHAKEALLFMLIKNPGRDNMDVGLEWKIDPSKHLPVGLEWKREELEEEKDMPTVKMGESTTVVILNISRVWEKIGL